MGYGSNEAKQDWLQRVRDYDGCWKQRVDVIAEADDDRHLGRSATPPSTTLPTTQLDGNERKSSRITRLRKLMKKLKIW